MNKPAKDTQYNLISLAEERWSPRAFRDQSISKQQLLQILEAARWSPSCFNEQPWRYVYAFKDGESKDYERLFDLMGEFNQAWAKMAPVLMVGIAKTNFTKNGKPNAHDRYDLGQSAAWLTAQAMSMDIYVHQMAGFDAEKAGEVLELPDGYEAVTMFALGYLGEKSDYQQLSEKHKETEYAPQERKPLSEIAFEGTGASL